VWPQALRAGIAAGAWAGLRAPARPPGLGDGV